MTCPPLSLWVLRREVETSHLKTGSATRAEIVHLDGRPLEKTKAGVCACVCARVCARTCVCVCVCVRVRAHCVHDICISHVCHIYMYAYICMWCVCVTCSRDKRLQLVTGRSWSPGGAGHLPAGLGRRDIWSLALRLTRWPWEAALCHVSPHVVRTVTSPSAMTYGNR